MPDDLSESKAYWNVKPVTYGKTPYMPESYLCVTDQQDGEQKRRDRLEHR